MSIIPLADREQKRIVVVLKVFDRELRGTSYRIYPIRARRFRPTIQRCVRSIHGASLRIVGVHEVETRSGNIGVWASNDERDTLPGTDTRLDG
jgi:hypothetical protein